MRYRWLVGLCVLALLAIMIGCSDEQKEEAAKLEQELIDQEQPAGEPAETTAEMPEEVTTEPETPAMDAGAIPEEEAEPEWVPPAPSGSGYVVQIASCEDRDYAQYLVGKFTNRGYSPFVTTFNHEGQTYYRVRLGPVETLAEARDLKNEIVDKYSITACWIDVE